MQDNRLPGADFLRATACLMVLSHHMLQRLDPAPLSDTAGWWLGFALTGSFGVTVFFVLSGYLLARPFWLALDQGEPLPSLKTYALRRAARILPGFWLALTVSFVVGFTLLESRFNGELVSRYLLGMALVGDWHWLALFPVDFNGPLWSIGFEISSYVFLPFCLALLFALRQAGWRARLVWCGVIVAVFCVHLLILNFLPVTTEGRGWRFGLIGGAKEWVPRFNPVGFFAIFALGALASGVQVMWRRHRSWGFDAVGFAGLALSVLILLQWAENPAKEGFGLAGIPYAFPLFPMAIGLALAALPQSVALGALLDNRVSRFVARISFGIYVWHYLVLELLRRFIDPRYQFAGMEDWGAWVWLSLLGGGITVAIATASYHWLEAPVIAWARRREGRRAAPEVVTAGA